LNTRSDITAFAQEQIKQARLNQPLPKPETAALTQLRVSIYVLSADLAVGAAQGERDCSSASRPGIRLDRFARRVKV